MKRMLKNYRLWVLALLSASAFLLCFAESESFYFMLLLKAAGAAIWWVTYMLSRFWDANGRLE